MSNESWEEQFKQFLQKTGEDFRRTGEDIKAEAQRLFDGAMDQDKQQRIPCAARPSAAARCLEQAVWQLRVDRRPLIGQGSAA